jgi:hypothetical protein
MSGTLVRSRWAVIGVKTESTAGTDAFSGSAPVAAETIACEIDVQVSGETIQIPELTAALDRAAGIPGLKTARVTLRVPLRGSGTAGTAPDWGVLMKACGMAELVTAATVGAPTAAASGTTSSVTLASPFGTTAQQYQGMPINFTGDQTTGPHIITDYTTGRVATLGAVVTSPTGSTLAQIPINVRYGPTSDESVFTTVTIVHYEDGIKHLYTGCTGSWAIELIAGQPAVLVFTMSAFIFTRATAVSFPTGLTNINRQIPPKFLGAAGGKSRLGLYPAQLRSLTIDAGVETVMPEDPEASQGIGVPVLARRDVTAQLDPFAVVSAAGGNMSTSALRYSRLQDGATGSLITGLGTSAGNRFAVTLPIVRIVDLTPQDRNDLGVDAIRLEADGADRSVYLCSY